MVMLFAYESCLPPICDGERGEYITPNFLSALNLATLKPVFRISGLTCSSRWRKVKKHNPMSPMDVRLQLSGLLEILV
jgi:hypothetical protein